MISKKRIFNEKIHSVKTSVTIRNLKLIVKLYFTQNFNTRGVKTSVIIHNLNLIVKLCFTRSFNNTNKFIFMFTYVSYTKTLYDPNART